MCTSTCYTSRQKRTNGKPLWEKLADDVYVLSVHVMGGTISALILWLVQFRLVSDSWNGILEWSKLL